MPRIDLSQVPAESGSGYPAPYDAEAGERLYRQLAPASGITDFAVNHVELPEGAWSSQRHWHEGEDEFLVVLSGRAKLVDDAGETPLAAGDCVAFPKGDGNGHHLIGGAGGCVFVVWGVPETTPCHYPDADLLLYPEDGFYRHKDGTPYRSPFVSSEVETPRAVTASRLRSKRTGEGSRGANRVPTCDAG